MLDKNTSFFEICQEPLLKEESKVEASQPPNSLKEMMSKLNHRLFHDVRTIYFTITDRKTLTTLQRKDSLMQYSQIRHRTKSQVVDDISA